MNKKGWKTTAYKTAGPLPPMTEQGKKIMSMAIGDYVIVDYFDGTRPQGGGEVTFKGKTFSMEPLLAGVKMTRIK